MKAIGFQLVALVNPCHRRSKSGCPRFFVLAGGPICGLGSSDACASGSAKRPVARRSTIRGTLADVGSPRTSATRQCGRIPLHEESIDSWALNVFVCQLNATMVSRTRVRSERSTDPILIVRVFVLGLSSGGKMRSVEISSPTACRKSRVLIPCSKSQQTESVGRSVSNPVQFREGFQRFLAFRNLVLVPSALESLGHQPPSDGPLESGPVGGRL
jgi:hypothetical protein